MNEYDKTINEIRTFNRFYTVNMGFLNSNYLDSKYSVLETRILFEIKLHKICIQSDIVKTLHIDKSYLSRIVQRFCAKGIVEKIKSDDDKRTTKITLTAIGNEETERLIQLTNQQIKAQIVELSLDECNKLCTALNTVISILGKEEN
ncbi:MAG: MarR family winged helix-turn-helix transcriptional regulator [Ruminococcus sp.]|nr:MarR family winged helix-turn-helix transcriptional regulator [Ruminococcus sp.]